MNPWDSCQFPSDFEFVAWFVRVVVRVARPQRGRTRRGSRSPLLLISSCEIDGRRTAGRWSVRSSVPCLRGSRREPPCGARFARCRARRRCRTCPRDVFRLRLCGHRDGGHDRGQARARGQRLRAHRADRRCDAHLLHGISRAKPLRPRGDPLLSGHRAGEPRQLAHRRGRGIRLNLSRRRCRWPFMPGCFATSGPRSGPSSTS